MAPVTRSARPVRHLNADDLGIGATVQVQEHGSNRPDDSIGIRDDDPLYVTVIDLLRFYGGVIFTGPPGTSKSYSAAKVATKLVEGDETRVRFVQFHPSYQYEDFMQGYVPDKDGQGFKMRDKVFVELCRTAETMPDKRFVIVIDELSRGEPGRVFGEALTYVERSKRGMDVTLASGDSFVVPDNLVVLATMNPLDRGVDEVDAAFERRFARIAMLPDRDILIELLDRNGVPSSLRDGVVGFFNLANSYASTNPAGAIGHTFFSDVADVPSLQRVWDFQLQFLVEKAYRLVPETRLALEAAFARTVETPIEDDPLPLQDLGAGTPPSDAIDAGLE